MVNIFIYSINIAWWLYDPTVFGSAATIRWSSWLQNVNLVIHGIFMISQMYLAVHLLIDNILNPAGPICEFPQQPSLFLNSVQLHQFVCMTLFNNKLLWTDFLRGTLFYFKRQLKIIHNTLDLPTIQRPSTFFVEARSTGFEWRLRSGYWDFHGRSSRYCSVHWFNKNRHVHTVFSVCCNLSARFVFSCLV